MINQRYILPVTFSAAVHAALLFGFPAKSIREAITVIEVPLAPLPPKPVEEIVPPAETDPTTPPVKELAGGPTPPDLEPPPAGPLRRDDIVIPEDAHSRNPTRIPTTIPRMSGPGDGTEWTRSVGSAAIDYTGLDNAPRAKVQPSPVYPARLRQDGISGTVEVAFEVNTAGHVVRAEATRFTHREFVEPALRAVRLWRFEPGRRRGRVVSFHMAVPIEFTFER